MAGALRIDTKKKSTEFGAIDEQKKLETLESRMVALRPMPLVDLKQLFWRKLESSFGQLMWWRRRY